MPQSSQESPVNKAGESLELGLEHSPGRWLKHGQSTAKARPKHGQSMAKQGQSTAKAWPKQGAPWPGQTGRRAPERQGFAPWKRHGVMFLRSAAINSALAEIRLAAQAIDRLGEGGALDA